MSANELIEWNRRWRLVQGAVVCKACLAQQLEKERAAAFLHHPDCVNATKIGLPWDELDMACRKFKRPS